MQGVRHIYKRCLMLNRATRNTAQFCARLLVCWLLLVPGALSYAAPAHNDLASLLCSPAEQTLSPSAETALKDLSHLLGQTNEDTAPSNGHCEFCTLVGAALPSPEQKLFKTSFEQQQSCYAAFEIGFVYKAQGPPSGSRAPPTLL